jgi:predicted alternative tryptophan synthase beta-subunit
MDSPPTQIDPSITIQFIEFTYTNDRYPKDKINAEIAKYTPLLYDIQMLGSKVAPPLVISGGARFTTHNPSIQTLKTTYNFKKSKIKETLKNINTIAKQHLSSIILYKRRLENNQPLPTT